MKRLFKVLSIILLVILSLLLLWTVLGIYKTTTFWVIVGLSIITLISFLLKNGKRMIMRERDVIDNQVAAKVPINHNKRNVFWGYVQLFSFLWVLFPFVFLIPASVARAYILPPVIIFFLVLCSYWQNMWIELGFTKGQYFLLHFCGILIPSTIVTILKIIIYITK